MAKVTITIEDAPEGKVRIQSDPTAETMMKMLNSGEGLTSAHGYAYAMLNRAREESKKNDPHKILVPRIGH